MGKRDVTAEEVQARLEGGTGNLKVDRRLARKLHRRVMAHLDEDFRTDFDQWLGAWVSQLAERMVLYPGRRAVVPDVIGYTVTLRWRLSDEDGLPYITSFSVELPPGMAFNPEHRYYEGDFDVGGYWAALALRLNTTEPLPESAERPSAGRRPPLDHYRRVLAEYDELVRNGHTSPISEIADRYGVRTGTAKSWLHRGRRYLKGA